MTPCRSRFLKSTTAGATAMSFAISSMFFPLVATAQSAADGQVVLNATSQQTTEQRLEDLERELQRANQTIIALQTGLGAMAKTVAQTQQMGQETQALVDEARTRIPDDLPEEFRRAIEDALDKVRPGDWAKDLPTDEAVGVIDDLKREAERIRAQVEASRNALNEAIRTTCGDATGVPWLSTGAVTADWTADRAVAALQRNVPLPPCLQNDQGQPIDSLKDYLEKQQAGQAMAASMNSMMMAAMSTGNPYIIAAAMALMVILAIFGDGGGNGDGDGERDGNGGGGIAGATTTTTPTTTTTSTTTATVGQQQAGNVGHYARFEVLDQLVTVNPVKQGEFAGFSAVWGPPSFRVAGRDDPITLPAFTNDIFVDAVDGPSESFSIRMTLDGCTDEDVVWLVIVDGTYEVDAKQLSGVCLPSQN